MPVRTFVSSADANDTFEVPSSARTAWLTSSRVVAFTTHAPNLRGSFFDATTMVLPALSRGNPYFSQHAAVSAKAGSICISSYGTPRLSSIRTTWSSITADSGTPLPLNSRSRYSPTREEGYDPGRGP